MARRPRASTETGWYHAMNRGSDRRDVFFGDADRVDFGVVLGAAHQQTGVEVHAYCLMPNHFHLILHANGDDDLSLFMHHLGTTYTRHLNDRHGRDGPIFRGRFHSVPITSDAQLTVTLRYVHLNPMSLDDVTDIDLYRWSSHRTYLGHRVAPWWLTVSTLREYFCDLDDYRQFVRAGPGGSTVHPTTLEHLVRVAVGERELDRRSRPGLIRMVTLVVIDRHPAWCQVLADSVHATTPGALRAARSRARQEFARDPEVQALVATVERFLGAPVTFGV